VSLSRTKASEPGESRAAVLRVFSPGLAGIWPRMHDGLREYIAAMHSHYEREFSSQRKAAPPRIAATVHGLVDAEIVHDMQDDAHAGQISCRKGCAHCCHLNVSATYPEAALLVALVREEKIPLDWARVKRQAQFAGPAVWHTQPFADQRCVFLSDDNACRVYEHRPSACRRHFVVSDPGECDTQKHPGHRVLNWIPVRAEVIVSAALAVFEQGSLPAMLLKAKKKKQ